MKVSVLLMENAKQIMLTPENDHERSALKIVAPGDKIEAQVKWGTMFDRDERLLGYEINKCQGGYYRAYENTDSLMLVVTSDKGKQK